MSPQPRLIRFMSRISLLALLAALGVVTWSTPAQARNLGGVIGYASYGHQEPPKGFESWCKFTAKIPCHCKPPAVTNFDTATGCSKESQAWADRDAENTCTILCTRATPTFDNGGVVLGRPGSSTGSDVSLEGAGTLAALESGGYVGFIPSEQEPIASSPEKEWLAEVLVQRTGEPFVVILDLQDSVVRWEDPKGSAAFVQTYWSNKGTPAPIGHCHHSLQRSCPLEDVKLGDSLQICSAESEEDARHIADTSCAPLRYNALTRSFRTWAVYGTQEDKPHGVPAATILAVGPQQFVGYLPSSLEVLKGHEDWTRLAEELLERTQGTAVWLAGPAKYYSLKE